MNPRDFTYKHKSKRDIIVVDDIITTGTTLSQAISCINKSENNALFCLTLADASTKN
jgi:competence protein ComFC